MRNVNEDGKRAHLRRNDDVGVVRRKGKGTAAVEEPPPAAPSTFSKPPSGEEAFARNSQGLKRSATRSASIRSDVGPPSLASADARRIVPIEVCSRISMNASLIGPQKPPLPVQPPEAVANA